MPVLQVPHLRSRRYSATKNLGFLYRMPQAWTKITILMKFVRKNQAYTRSWSLLKVVLGAHACTNTIGTPFKEQVLFSDQNILVSYIECLRHLPNSPFDEILTKISGP